jgi:DNA-binding HxlR family transcriptional regulator
MPSDQSQITALPQPSPARRSAKGSGTRRLARAATAVLADRASRAVLLTLGEARDQALSVELITDRSPVDASRRLIRDRVRELGDAGIVSSTGHGPSISWSLTPAGQDLYRLHALITRIVVRATDLDPRTPPSARERAVELTLAALSDPVVVQITRALAAEQRLDPLTLEQRCYPTPRRTLYRRLTPLVTAGAVVRATSHEVPRHTHYELADRWRPATAILMLTAWWEWRHPEALDSSPPADLEGVLFGILPITPRVHAPDGALMRCVVTDAGAAGLPLLRVNDGALELTSGEVEAPADVTVTGSPRAWTSALVTDQTDGLLIEGDTSFARTILTAIRNALLRYVG